MDIILQVKFKVEKIFLNFFLLRLLIEIIDYSFIIQHAHALFTLKFACIIDIYQCVQIVLSKSNQMTTH